MAAGALRDGDELPSVRAVAQQYVINPMTVSKAYSLLEAQGVLERRRGMGMLVRAREGEGAATGERLALLQPALEQAARAARQLGIAPDDALAAFQQTLLQSMPGDDGQETPHEY